jgi:hypothetical protein
MSHGQMHISDGSMAMNMNVQHHMEHFDNVLNLNMNNDYHYGMEYWNGNYKNGSTPMKEMEGEMKPQSGVIACSICGMSKQFNALSHLSTHSLTPCEQCTLAVSLAIPDSDRLEQEANEKLSIFGGLTNCTINFN